MTKEAVQKVVDTLPDEVTIDDIVERLILIQSFDEGRKQYEAGQFVTHDEVGKRLDKWLK
ncbi:hypothetical protein [Fibrella aquatilis]|uniref:Addiction module component n=1 Tax=Fibrella aquatilis TaxID=2817059 RepID=A0A939FZH0_9BACT|nr:hypothetical protein [Fibrella aquatilis]MBO0929592.1 hypothetical protein [Fibrella aquatilis]